jgi:hypothetical protein
MPEMSSAAEITADQPKRQVGRPSAYSQKTAQQICELLTEPMSLREIARLPDMPPVRTIMNWLLTHEEFRQQYAQAREYQADAIFDEVIEIADDGTNDWMARQSAEDRELYELNGEHVQRSRLRIDARKWAAGKLAPKKYGDKLTAEVTGADGAPLMPAVSVVIGAARPEPLVIEQAPKYGQKDGLQKRRPEKRKRIKRLAAP